MTQHRETGRHYSVQDASSVPEYQLGFGDEIEVKFFSNERFNEIVAVRPDGRISLEKVGDIFVIGMTPSQLDSLVTSIYSEIIKRPDVTIFVRKFGGYQVYVLGEVESPGGYPIQRNMTLLQALAVAGGTKNTAKLGNTMVLRRSEKGLGDVLKVDLSRPVDKDHGALIDNDLRVQPADIVYVPKTFISSANSFLKQIYDGLFPPLDIYVRALWYSRWLD